MLSIRRGYSIPAVPCRCSSAARNGAACTCAADTCRVPISRASKMAETFIADLCERIRDAGARKAPLRIRGGGTKDFYGAPARGELLDVSGYAGIVAYE